MPEDQVKQQRIAKCLAEIARQPDFPAFSTHIQEVMSAVEDENASLRQLTDIVLRDYSLTLRVLRMANSVCYSRSGRTLVSVAHSITLLGTEAIRGLAGGVALFEHYRKISPGLKELMLLSILTANQTRAVAATINYRRPEEAYICGMFRNLGEVLIAGYYPREYAAILSERSAQSLGEREACLRVLQFTFEDLGQAMAARWQLPDRVGQCMLPVDPTRLAADENDELAALRAAASFSHALTTAVYRREPEGAAARVHLLIQDYSPVLGLREEDVNGVLEAGLRETKATFAALNIPVDELRLRKQAQAVLENLAAGGLDEPPAELIDQAPGGEEFLHQISRDVESTIKASGDFDLHGVILMILEALYRGGPFDRVLFCLADPDHTVMLGRLALGQGAEDLRAKFRVPISVRGGLMGTALVRRQDLFVTAASSFAENEALKSVGAVSLGVYPILVDGVLGGCLYFDRLSVRPAPPARTLEMLARLRDLAARAIAIRRPMPA